MPRKGPKKLTSRDLREEERKAEEARRKREAHLVRNEEVALGNYERQHNPNMPSTKGEQRALRRALKKQGKSLESWRNSEASSHAHSAAKREAVVFISDVHFDDASTGDDEHDEFWHEDDAAGFKTVAVSAAKKSNWQEEEIHAKA